MLLLASVVPMNGDVLSGVCTDDMHTLHAARRLLSRIV